MAPVTLLPTEPGVRFRFGVFEADVAAGELRRAGARVKLNVQPFQLLLLLLARPGEVLSREELARELWPDGTFVDFEHGVNSAVNRVREALGDSARNPRFVETLARRGYRFVAPVERVGGVGAAEVAATDMPAALPEPQGTGPVARPVTLLPTAQDLPNMSAGATRTLFVLLQGMYLAFYVGALANLAEVEDLLAPLQHGRAVFEVVLLTAALLIPVRVFLASAAVLRPPNARGTLLRLWTYVLPFDVLWSLAPFLLLHHMNAGLALACVAVLVYSPFAQRSLVLMGAVGDG